MPVKLTIIIEVGDREEVIYKNSFDDIVRDLEGDDYNFNDAKEVVIEYCKDYNPFKIL